MEKKSAFVTSPHFKQQTPPYNESAKRKNHIPKVYASNVF